MIIIGVVVAAIGLTLLLFGNKLGWFGHLPGDIRVEKPGFSFYMPISSMILISMVLSAVWWVVRRFLG